MSREENEMRKKEKTHNMYKKREILWKVLKYFRENEKRSAGADREEENEKIEESKTKK